ncbi:winged helix-turn-helix domain-containing protein [Aeromonas schubertii]|uniref:Transcriptional regulator n=1 Tax=Aeromonas schubertii TaxID=652 RepID=A0A0S2SFB5_9GAMM|nr:winged helix-turn-helix domain-containing protein [Aeromonas schubertii]ALP40385.1 transcriptional regulator [Aeromonas schubertii]
MINTFYKIAEDILFFPAVFRLAKGEREVKLSNKETELLEILCNEAGAVVPRNQLQEALWPNQESTDTNLNRQILSLRRKFEAFGVMDAIDTIPRVGYLFTAAVEPGYREEETPQEDPAAPVVYRRRKSDRLFSRKRILMASLLLLTLLLVAYSAYRVATANSLKSIDISNVSLYMTRYAEQIHGTSIELLARQLGQGTGKRASILIGQEAISYVTFDPQGRLRNENVFLLRDGSKIDSELRCVLDTMAAASDAVSADYTALTTTTLRFHQECRAGDEWVEISQRSHLLKGGKGREIIVAALSAVDSQGRRLFTVDTVGDVDKIDEDFVVEISNTTLGNINHEVLLRRPLVATMMAAFRSPKQKAHYILLPDGLYFSSYLGGVLTWSSQESLKGPEPHS